MIITEAIGRGIVPTQIHSNWRQMWWLVLLCFQLAPACSTAEISPNTQLAVLAKVSLTQVCLWEEGLQSLWALPFFSICTGHLSPFYPGTQGPQVGLCSPGWELWPTVGVWEPRQALSCLGSSATWRETCCVYSHPRQTQPSEGCTSFFVSHRLLVAGTVSSHIHGKYFTHPVCHHNVIIKNTQSYYTVSATTKVHL